MSGIMGGLAQGMIFGAGSSMGHRAVDSVMGAREMHVVHEGAPGAAAASGAAAEPVACQNQMKAFNDCVQQNMSDVGMCQFYLDSLRQCKGEI